jgi:heme/copper-type cytochrome/quinol oxidase subunit 4
MLRRDGAEVGGAVAVFAVLVGGWSAAALLLIQALRLTLFDATEPRRTIGMVLYLIGMALIPAAAAVAAWLAADYGWSATAWVLGVLAAVIAVAVGIWMFLFATTT